MDPLTLSLLIKAVGTGVKAVGDSRAAKRESDFYGDIQKQGERQAGALEDRRSDLYAMGPTMRKYMQYAMQDPTADIERKQLSRSTATNLDALKSVGAKGLIGGLSRLEQQRADNLAGIGQREDQRKTQAFQTYGNVEQMLRSAERRDVGNDLAMARGQAASGLEGKFRADQYKKQIGNRALASGLDALGSFAAAGGFGDNPFGKSAPTGDGGGGIEDLTINTRNLQDVAIDGVDAEGYEIPLSDEPDLSINNVGGLLNLLGQGTTNAPASTAAAAGGVGSQIPMDLIQALYPGLASVLGFNIPNMPMGKGGRTKGKFDHSSNDMKITDKNGNPTGMSVTGGEVVLNPEQQKNVAKESSYFRSLMKTPRFR